MMIYLGKAFTLGKTIWGAAFALLNYLLFPDEAFMTAAMAVGIAILLDIITKYAAISKKSGGFCKAIRTKKIYSKTLWDGTKIKLFSYLIIFILAGLSYRVTMLEQVSVFLSTVIYTVIFLREAQSIIENLCDAGADLKWLAVWTKKKQDQILESDGQRNDDQEGGDDNAKTI